MGARSCVGGWVGACVRALVCACVRVHCRLQAVAAYLFDGPKHGNGKVGGENVNVGGPRRLVALKRLGKEVQGQREQRLASVVARARGQ